MGTTTSLNHSKVTFTNKTMDSARESVGDKAARNLQPESTKSTGQKVEDTARDAYESVAGTVQPDSQKSAGQGLTDTLSNNDKASNAGGESLATQAMNAVG